MQRWKVYAAAFAAILAAYAAYAVWRYARGHEKFAQPHSGKDEACDGDEEDEENDAGYRARMCVMDAFEKHLHRKATVAEVRKYSALGPSCSKITAVILTDLKPPPDDQPEETDDEDDCHTHKKQDNKNKNKKIAGSDSDSDSESDDDEPKKKSHKKNTAPASSAYPPAQGGDRCTDTEDAEEPDYGYTLLPAKDIIVHKSHSTTAASPIPAPYSTGIEVGSCNIKSTTRDIIDSPSQHRVCLDKADVLARLRAISHEVEQFSQLVQQMAT